MVLQDINFEFDSADLTEKSKGILDSVAEAPRASSTASPRRCSTSRMRRSRSPGIPILWGATATT